MTAAQDAARRMKNHTFTPDSGLLARFVLAVCEPDEALVETVARALWDKHSAGLRWGQARPAEQRHFLDLAAAALAAVAQSAGGERGPAVKTDPRCTGTLGSRPSWMSPDQYDADGGPCRCEREAGHDGPHACEHKPLPAGSPPTTDERPEP